MLDSDKLKGGVIVVLLLGVLAAFDYYDNSVNAVNSGNRITGAVVQENVELTWHWLKPGGDTVFQNVRGDQYVVGGSVDENGASFLVYVRPFESGEMSVETTPKLAVGQSYKLKDGSVIELKSKGIYKVVDGQSVYQAAITITSPVGGDVCTDSDFALSYRSTGVDKSTAGEAHGSHTGAYDFCDFSENQNTLLEAYCGGDTAAQTKINCNSENTGNPYCNRGVCSSIPPKCEETDKGSDPFAKGTVTPAHDSYSRYEDYCRDLGNNYGTGECSGEFCAVNEYMCKPESGAPGSLYGYSETIECPLGCRNGACTQGQTVTRISQTELKLPDLNGTAVRGQYGYGNVYVAVKIYNNGPVAVTQPFEVVFRVNRNEFSRHTIYEQIPAGGVLFFQRWVYLGSNDAKFGCGDNTLEVNVDEGNIVNEVKKINNKGTTVVKRDCAESVIAVKLTKGWNIMSISALAARADEKTAWGAESVPRCSQDSISKKVYAYYPQANTYGVHNLGDDKKRIVKSAVSIDESETFRGLYPEITSSSRAVWIKSSQDCYLVTSLESQRLGFTVPDGWSLIGVPPNWKGKTLSDLLDPGCNFIAGFFYDASLPEFWKLAASDYVFEQADVGKGFWIFATGCSFLEEG